ncbi:MAG: YihY/virulence factor BrkB family protein [Candidatus Krumholzibacteriota bacterium]|nr:YihY/virulence factor BrkB family protein [Candidatus Krumholzibacteriota bacterium]
MHPLHPKSVVLMFRDAGRHWYRDDIPAQAAALAYHAILSLAPLLILLVGTMSLIFGADKVKGEIVLQVQEAVGLKAAQAVQSVIKNTHIGVTGTLAIGGTSIVLLFVFATGFFDRLISALNSIWKYHSNAKPGVKHDVLRLIKRRFLAFLIILGMGLWLYLSLVVKAVKAIPESYILNAFPGAGQLIPYIPMITSPLVFAAIFVLLFKIMPDANIRWRDVLFGSAVTAVIFVIGHRLIGLYLRRAMLASFYGAAGSLVIILLWIYWAAMIMLFGAELTRAYTERHGSLKDSEAFLN